MAIYSDLDGTRKSSFSVGTASTGKIQIVPRTGLIFSDGTIQPTAASASSPAYRVPTDSYDILVYTCDETSGALVNTGTLGTSNNLVLQTGTPSLGEAGIFGNCAHALQSSAIRYEASKTGAEPAYPITVSCWIKPSSLPSSVQQIFAKYYRVYGSWTSPYIAMSLAISTSNLAWASITTGTTGSGVLTQTMAPASYPLLVNTWTHLGLTYDGAFLRLYVNGNFVSSAAKTGAIDYNTSGGPWVVGMNGSGGETFKGAIDDIRVASGIARDVTWFRKVYRAGMGLYGVSPVQVFNVDRRVAPDSDDLLVYTFDETSGTYSNTGTLGATGNLSTAVGTPVMGENGVYSNSVRFTDGSRARLDTSSSVAEPSSYLTVSAWIYPTKTHTGHVVGKLYTSGTGWTSPYNTARLYTEATTNYVYAELTTGSATHFVASGTINNALSLNDWNHIGLSYDGVNLKLYVNGNLAGTTAATGAIDYTNHQPWEIGSCHSSDITPAYQPFSGRIDDVRVAQIARSADWFRQVYLSGRPTTVFKSPDTPVTLSWNTASQVYATASGSVGYVTLQDNRQRTFSGTLVFDPSTGAGDGGLDTGTEAISTWYYLYLVPRSGNDPYITIRGSVSPPSTGPTGYALWKYVGAVRNNASGDIPEFYQFGNEFLTPALTGPALTTSFYDPPTTLDLSDYLPVTASIAQVLQYLQRSGADGYSVFSAIRVYGYTNNYTLIIASQTVNNWEAITARVPVPGSIKRITYYSYRDGGTCTIGSQRVYFQGWVDGYIFHDAIVQSTGPWTVSGSNIYYSAGNVGVGTSTPYFPIDVAGNVRIQGSNELRFGGTGASDYDVNIYRSAASTLKTDSSLTVAGASLSVTGTSGTTVTPSTNATALTLNGTNVTSANLAYFNAKNTSGTIFNTAYGAAATLAGSLIGQTLDLNTNVTNAAQSATGLQIKMPPASAASGNTFVAINVPTAGAIVNSSGTSTWTGVNLQMPAITQSSGTLTSTGIKITGGAVTSGTAYAIITDANAGNVGFGNPAPGLKLGVSGAKYADGALNAEVQIADTTAYSGSPSAGVLFSNKYNSSGDYAGMGGIAVNKENATDGNYAGYLALYTRANGSSIAERMRITSAGAVGINTDTPGDSLEIKDGGIVLRSSTSDDTPNLAFFGNTARRVSMDGYGAFYRFVSEPNGGGSGYVGALINLSQSAFPTDRAVLGFPGTGFTQVGCGLGSTSATAESGDLTFFAGGQTSERMRIVSGGNVGIGTTDATSKLTVSGDIKLYATGNKLTFYDGAYFSNHSSGNAIELVRTQYALQIMRATGSDTTRIAGMVFYDGTTPRGNFYTVVYDGGTAGGSTFADYSDINTYSGMYIRYAPDDNTKIAIGIRNTGNVKIGGWTNVNDTLYHKLDIAGDTRIQGSYKLYFGGTAGTGNDVNLYRSTTDTLKTDDIFHCTEIHLTDNSSGTKGVTFADGTRQDTAAIGASVFAATHEPTGFLDRSATLSWTNTSPDRTFTITGSHTIYIDGAVYSKTTASIQIANTTGLHIIYYDTSGVLSESLTFPGFFVPIIATVYWNSSTSKGVLAEERHGITMDGATHGYLHSTIGTRYISGLALSSITNTTFQVDSGSIADEDLTLSIPPSTTCDVFYKNGSVNFEWESAQTAIYGSSMRYNNGNTLTTVSNGYYAAYWVFASNAVGSANDHVTVIIGQRQDNTIAAARANNTYEALSFGTLPFKEMKLLYRVLYQKNSGGSPIYQESADYRSVSNVPSGTYVATSHSTLSGLSNDDHTQYALLAGRDAGQTLIGGSATSGNMVLVGGQLTTSTLTFKATTGAGASGSDIIFTVGNNGATEAARILYDGKIGIGTASPDFTVDVAGNIRIEGTGSNKLYFGGTGSSDNDVNLYRGGSDILKTDDAFVALSGTFNSGTTPADVVVLDIAQPGSAGTRDSHNLIIRGTSYDTGGHNADWKAYANVTSNAGASTLKIQSRIDSGSYADRATLDDSGNLSAVGALVAAGGVHVNTSTSKPSAGSTYRGMLWLTQGGTGVADVLEVCIKNSSDSYEWKTITLS